MNNERRARSRWFAISILDIELRHLLTSDLFLAFLNYCFLCKNKSRKSFKLNRFFKPIICPSVYILKTPPIKHLSANSYLVTDLVSKMSARHHRHQQPCRLAVFLVCINALSQLFKNHLLLQFSSIVEFNVATLTNSVNRHRAPPKRWIRIAIIPPDQQWRKESNKVFRAIRPFFVVIIIISPSIVCFMANSWLTIYWRNWQIISGLYNCQTSWTCNY